MIDSGNFFVPSASAETGKNFEIITTDPQAAKEFKDAAEIYRKKIAQDWFGGWKDSKNQFSKCMAIPDWRNPVKIKIYSGEHLGGGAVTFNSFDGDYYHGRGTIQGEKSGILSAILPHEIWHMIISDYFGKGFSAAAGGSEIPRCLDEGMAVYQESPSMRKMYVSYLANYIKAGGKISVSEILNAKEYPENGMVFYGECYTLVRFLLKQPCNSAEMNSKQKIIALILEAAVKKQDPATKEWRISGYDWEKAFKKFYGMNLSELQNRYLEYVRDYKDTVCDNVAEGLAKNKKEASGDLITVRVILFYPKSIDPAGASAKEAVNKISNYINNPIKNKIRVELTWGAIEEYFDLVKKFGNEKSEFMGYVEFAPDGYKFYKTGLEISQILGKLNEIADKY